MCLKRLETVTIQTIGTEPFHRALCNFGRYQAETKQPELGICSLETNDSKGNLDVTLGLLATRVSRLFSCGADNALQWKWCSERSRVVNIGNLSHSRITMV